MSIGLCSLLALTLSLSYPAAESAPRWSEDGRWIAFIVARPSQGHIPEPGWVFEGSGPGATLSTLGGMNDRTKLGLYVSSTSRDEAWLIEESSELLTTPEWSPSGRALSYGRVRRGAGSSADRFELVVHESLSTGRILHTRPLSLPISRVDAETTIDTSRVTIAWSPDGRYLAVGLPEDLPSTIVIRADNGRLVKTIDDTFWPSWSPDSSHLVLVRGTLSHSLIISEAGTGGTTKLADVGRLFQPVVWSQDGKTVACLARRPLERPGRGTATIDFFRISTRTGEFEGLVNLGAESAARGAVLRGISHALDHDWNDLFYTLEQEGRPSEIVWTLPRTSETLSRKYPLDFAVMVRALSLSPKENTLAVRLGQSSGVIALWDYSKDILTPFTPDDEARIAWLSLLVDTARRLLSTGLPGVTIMGKRVARPTLLPVPGEIPSNHEIVFRLKRLARVARPLCDQASGSSPASPQLERFLAEARLFFDILAQNFRSSLVSLEKLETGNLSSDQRLALLGIRAQILLGMGEWDRAKDPIDYMIHQEERTTSRLEFTPAGTALTAEPGRSQGWARYLSLRVKDLASSRRDQARFARGKPPMIDAGLFPPPRRMGERDPNDPVMRIPKANPAGQVPLDLPPPPPQGVLDRPFRAVRSPR